MRQLDFLGSNLDTIVNVSQVRHRSPFRYPGGKTWLVPRVRQWLLTRGRPAEFVEPFCGGAIVGLSVAFDRLAGHVTLIERDPQVAAAWQVILHGSQADVEWLIDRIVNFPMTREQAAALLSSPPKDLREQAFMTIVKNRVQPGGCLAKGAGLIRSGENGKGIGSRWYPTTIARRIQDIQRVREAITFLCTDALDYLAQNPGTAETAFFIDPPYWVAGPRLYDYSDLDHGRLFDLARQLGGDFLMTYDDVDEIHHLAETHHLATRTIRMQNKNHVAKEELLIGRDLGWVDNAGAIAR